MNRGITKVNSETSQGDSKKSTIGKRVAIALATLFIAGGTLVATVPANAAIVPNRYYCDPLDNYCYQVNGAYNPAVHRECHWKLSFMVGTPHQIHTSQCNTWGPNVP